MKKKVTPRAATTARAAAALKRGWYALSRYSKITPARGQRFIGGRSMRMSGRMRRYLIEDIERALSLIREHGMAATRKMLPHIPYHTLYTWSERNKPLDGEIYPAEVVRQIVLKARARALRENLPPHVALLRQWLDTGFNLSSFRVYLTNERIPVPADFVIYLDPECQARVVTMWNTQLHGTGAQDKGEAETEAEEKPQRSREELADLGRKIKGLSKKPTEPPPVESLIQRRGQVYAVSHYAPTTEQRARQRYFGYGFRLVKNIPPR